MKRLWRVVKWPLIGIAMLFILLLIFNGAVIRYLIHNYSEEYTGRQINVQDVNFNLFNGNIRLNKLNVKEDDGVNDFININKVELDLSIYKIWFGDYQLTSFDLIEPEVEIIQNGGSFNFDDIVAHFASDTTAQDTTGQDPVWFELVDLNVIDGKVTYRSDLISEDLFVNHLQLNVDTVASYRSLINCDLEMDIGWGGSIGSSINLDLENRTYATKIRSDRTKLNAFKAYVEPYMNIGELEGELNTDLTLSGNFDDNLGIALNGTIEVKEFAMTDPQAVKLVGVENCLIKIDSINVRDELYDVDRLHIEAPYLFFELYEEDDNFSRLNVYDSTAVSEEVVELGYDPSNPFSLLAHYAKEVFHSYKDGSFRLDSVDLLNGRVIYNDHSLYDVFEYELTGLSITSHDINSNEKEFEVNVNSVLNEVGSLNGKLTFDPHTTRNMQLAYTIEDVVMPNFGPYSVFYTALPIMSGSTRYTANTVISDNKIQSENHLFVEDFNFGKKNKEVKEAYNLPLRFAVSLLKDADGNIDLNIPIEGDLDDPDYKVGKIVWQVLGNLAKKAVSSPYKALSRTFDADEEDLKNVHFLYLQNDLTGKQEKPLNILGRVLSSKPEMRVELIQSGNKELEQNKYAVYMAKARYYMEKEKTTIDLTDPANMDNITAIASKDSLFIEWLDGQIGINELPFQNKCEKLIGIDDMKLGVDERWRMRNELVENYLTYDKELPTDRFTVRDISPTDTIVAAGAPRFQIIYSMEE